MPDSKLAVVTGASTGIGLELARECAKHKFDLVVAANEPEIVSAADDLRREGAKVEAVRADLATLDGVDELYVRWTHRSGIGPDRRVQHVGAAEKFGFGRSRH
jgi:NAD(P)-dependent dehydrogenase (short-subunit alcohol dehydrogenase family)